MVPLLTLSCWSKDSLQKKSSVYKKRGRRLLIVGCVVLVDKFAEAILGVFVQIYVLRLGARGGVTANKFADKMKLLFVPGTVSTHHQVEPHTKATAKRQFFIH